MKKKLIKFKNGSSVEFTQDEGDKFKSAHDDWYCFGNSTGKNKSALFYLLYMLLGKAEYEKILKDLEKL